MILNVTTLPRPGVVFPLTNHNWRCIVWLSNDDYIVNQPYIVHTIDRTVPPTLYRLPSKRNRLMWAQLDRLSGRKQVPLQVAMLNSCF